MIKTKASNIRDNIKYNIDTALCNFAVNSTRKDFTWETRQFDVDARLDEIVKEIESNN